MAEGDLQIRMKGGSRLRATAGQFRKKIVGAALDEMVEAWGRQAVASLREATPKETPRPDQPWRQHPPPGAARESWRWDHVPTQHAVKVSNTQPHTLFLFSGTQAHPIPREKEEEEKTEGGFLAFFWAKKSRWVKTPSVYHPGTEPVPELVEALDRLNRTAEVMFHETANGIVTTIMQPIGGIGGD